MDSETDRQKSISHSLQDQTQDRDERVQYELGPQMLHQIQNIIREQMREVMQEYKSISPVHKGNEGDQNTEARKAGPGQTDREQAAIQTQELGANQGVEMTQKEPEVEITQTRGTQEFQGSINNMTNDPPGGSTLLPMPLTRCDSQQEDGQSVDKRQTKDEVEVGSSDKTNGKGEIPASGVKDILNTMRYTNLPPPTFTGGSCGDYWVFKQAFERHVEAANHPYDVKLQSLLKAYSGPLTAALQRSILVKEPKLGYEQAFKLLDKHYGNKRRYAKELVRKVKQGGAIHWNDTQGLEQLVYDLTNCVTNLQDFGYMKEIDSETSMRTIINRFEGGLRECYDSRAFEYQRQHAGEPPGIEWLQLFLEEMLERAEWQWEERNQDDLIPDKIRQQGKPGEPSSSQMKPVALTTVATEDLDGGDQLCHLCQGHHSLSGCKIFHNLPIKARLECVKNDELCFSCLKRGHRIATCNKRELCGVEGCTSTHAEVLHGINRFLSEHW